MHVDWAKRKKAEKRLMKEQETTGCLKINEHFCSTSAAGDCDDEDSRGKHVLSGRT